MPAPKINLSPVSSLIKSAPLFDDPEVPTEFALECKTIPTSNLLTGRHYVSAFVTLVAIYHNSLVDSNIEDEVSYCGHSINILNPLHYA
jgi:hypothetical protein